MHYHLSQNGKDLGTFPLDELHRRRQSGELNGTEFVWRKGMDEWKALDSVLHDQYGLPAADPPVAARNRNRTLFWVVPAGLALLLVVVAGSTYVMHRAQARVGELRQQLIPGASEKRGLDLARPVFVSPDTRTATDADEIARDFRARHFLDAYRKKGSRNHSCDSESLRYIRMWIDGAGGAEIPADDFPFDETGKKLASESDCVDPLILAVAATENDHEMERIRRLNRALDELAASAYGPYPKFWATVVQSANLRHHPARLGPLDTAARELFDELVSDGSFPPDDQEILAENLIYGWGAEFFERNAAELCALAEAAEPEFEWLSAVLDGERHLTKAWKAREGGISHTMSRRDKDRFFSHMAAARSSFTKAWEMNPGTPLVPSRMIYVAMGESEPKDMRLWFDRALDVQIDYLPAWDQMRRALHPLWHGSREAMLALGIAALDTGRFDTDAPRVLFDVLRDIERKNSPSDNEPVFARDDIWPHVERLHKGYITEASQAGWADNWRASLATIAYLAGRYDVAREQLESLEWNLPENELLSWKAGDFSLITLEVAARTGAHADTIARAEEHWKRNQQQEALRLYSDLQDQNLDDRTRAFVEARLDILQPARQTRS